MSFSQAPTRVGSLDESYCKDPKTETVLTDDAASEQHNDPVPAAVPVEDAAAWLRVLAAFLVFIMTWGPSTGIGAFESYYQNTLLQGHTPSEIAWIGSMQTFLLMSVGVVSGPLFDQGYFRVIMTLGLFMCVLAFMLLSFCTEYYQIFLTQGVLFGMGTGLAYVPCMAMVSVRFHRHKAIAMGVVASGSSVGGIIFPILIRRLVPQVGFAWTARTIGFIQLAISLVALSILLRDQEEKTKRPPRRIIELRAFTEAPFALFSVGFLFQSIAYWLPFAFFPSFAINHLHASEDLGFYLLAACNAASAAGRILPSVLAHRIGAFNVFMAATVACTVVEAAWVACDTVGGFVAVACLWGFFSGVVPSIAPVCVAARPLSPDLAVTGSRLGVSWLMGGVGVLIGSPIAGMLVDVDTGDFVKAQAFGAAAMALTAVLYVWPWICQERIRRAEGKA